MRIAFHDTEGLARLTEGHGQLMQRLCAAMTDDMLEEIAAADYGSDFARHLAALRVIRDDGVPSGQMGWEPKEVLELFRWSEFGDNRTGQRPRSVFAFHQMRAFCCAALLTVAVDATGFECLGGGPNSIVVQLVDSLEALGSDWERDGVAFLSWALQRVPEREDEAAFFVLGLVWLLVRTGAATAQPAMTLALCDWLFALEAQVYEVWGQGVGSAPDVWLLRITHFGSLFTKWRAIGQRLAGEAVAVADPALAARLGDIGRGLGGEI